MSNPSSARRALKRLWKSWRVDSLADGTLRIVPKWRSPIHGLLTRLYAADKVDEVLKGKK